MYSFKMCFLELLLFDPIWWQFLSVMIYFKYWLLRPLRLTEGEEIFSTIVAPPGGIKCSVLQNIVELRKSR